MQKIRPRLAQILILPLAALIVIALMTPAYAQQTGWPYLEPMQSQQLLRPDGCVSYGCDARFADSVEKSSPADASPDYVGPEFGGPDPYEGYDGSLRPGCESF